MPVAGMLYFSKNFIFNLFSIVLAGYHAGDVGVLSRKFLTLITAEHHPAKMGKMFAENLELFSTCQVGWQAHLLHAQCCIPFSQNQVIIGKSNQTIGKCPQVFGNAKQNLNLRPRFRTQTGQTFSSASYIFRSQLRKIVYTPSHQPSPLQQEDRSPRHKEQLRQMTPGP